MLKAIQELEWPQVSQKGYPQVSWRCCHCAFQSCYRHVFLQEPALDDRSCRLDHQVVCKIHPCLKSSAFLHQYSIKSIVIMVGDVVFYLSSQPWWRVTHQKLYFWYEDSCWRRARKNILRFYLPCIDIFGFVLGIYVLGIPDNFGHFASIGEKEPEIGAVYDILAFVDTVSRVTKPWRLYQNILFLVFGCWRAGEKW